MPKHAVYLSDCAVQDPWLGTVGDSEDARRWGSLEGLQTAGRVVATSTERLGTGLRSLMSLLLTVLSRACIYLSIYLSIYLFIYLSIYLFISRVFLILFFVLGVSLCKPFLT